MPFRSFIFILVTLFCFVRGFAQLSGNYTIGGVSPNYPTIQAAITDLNTVGVSGDVHFKLRSGSYNERVTIGLVSGVSQTSQVTFESETGDSSDVWWTSSSTTSSNNYIVSCSSARYVNFRNISFRNTGYYGSTVFLMSGGVSNCTIEGNHLKGSTSYSSPENHILISSPGAFDSNFLIKDNHFEDGGYGIKMLGVNNSTLDSNIVVLGNTFTSHMGVEFTYVENVTVSGNVFNCFFRGIVIANFANPVEVSFNKVSTNLQALRLTNFVGTSNIVPANQTLVLNNFLSGMYGAVEIQGGFATQIINNSVLNRSTVDIYNAVLISTPATLKNNIIINEDEGVAFKVPTNVTVVSDYNLINTEGTYLVNYYGNNYNSLNAWQNSVYSGDLHSYQGPAYFTSSSDLHLISNSLCYNNGQVHSYVTNDIDGQLRGSSPDIGADEFVQPNVDAGISSVYSGLDTLECTGMNNVIVRLKNYGLNTLVSSQINWTYNGILQPPIFWSGSVAYNQTSADILIPFELYQDSFASIVVWSSNPNNSIDALSANDTLIIDTTFTRMMGDYYVGSSMSDYSTISSAVADIDLRGMCGNVRLLLNSGVYYENIYIPQLFKENINDTLFITSVESSPDSVILHNAGLDTYEWILRMNRNNIVYVSDLSIEVLNYPSNYEEGCVKIFGGTSVPINDSSAFEFSNCEFGFVSNSPGYTGIYSNADYLSARNCSFTNLNQGIFLPDLNQIQNKMVEVIGCTFNEILAYSIYADKINRVTIDGNDFNNVLDSYVNFPITAILLDELNGEANIRGNKFSGRFNEILRNYSGTIDTSRFVNNSISCTYIGSNNADLTYFGANSNWKVNFNSFNVKNDHNWQTGILMNSFVRFGLVNWAELKNNSFKADSVNVVVLGLNLHISPIAVQGYAGYNNISVDYIQEGYCSCGTNSFVTPSHTTFLEPSYTAFDDLHLVHYELAGLGIDAGTEFDLDSNLRMNPPTIGAYEAQYYDGNVYIENMDVVPTCDSFTVIVDVYNNGLYAVDSMWFQVNINGMSDSIFVNSLIEPYEDLDSIILVTLPLNHDSVYDINTVVNLLDYEDELLTNNSFEHQVSFPYVDSVNLGNDTLLCFGDSFSLNVSPPNLFQTISWNNNSIIGVYTVFASSGVNSVVVQDVNGCFYTDTIVVTVDPNPLLTIEFANDTLFGNQIADWFLDGALFAEDTLYVVPLEEGVYSYTWISQNDCEYSVAYVYSEATLTDYSETYKYSVYPNPTKDKLAVSSSDPNETMTVQVMDINGKVLSTQSLLSGAVIDVSVISSGIYFVRILNENNEATQVKFIKE